MHTIEQLEKQQIGLRLPQYMIDDIDEFTEKFSVNRTDIIMEALRSYIKEQRVKTLYDSFNNACKEVKAIENGEIPTTTLRELIDELESDSNA